MKYLSVCSGIEAASCAWEPLGWKPVGFSEIEPFPSAVLAHRFPGVKNYGDMTKYKEWESVGQFDVLVGGTPCQSFSVAGLRKGLDDPRGNLMLTFGAIADYFKPTRIVWENVPGVLSSNGGRDFKSFLDMMEYIGYIVDIDILDAQFFGVPQRRRRVFICGRRSEDILNRRTNTSSLIIIQFLQEISRNILTVALHQSGNVLQNSESLNRLNDGLERRMMLFGLVGEKDNSRKLLESLVEVFQKRLQELKSLDATLGEYEKELIQEGRSMDSSTAGQYILTEQSLSEVLGEVLKVAKLYIISTGIRIITQSETFMFSKLVLLTGKLIALLNRSSPCFWSAASSSLISITEYISYARQTTSDLFGDLERIHYWDDFIGKAVRLQEFIGSIGVENFGKVLPITESLSGNPPPSREEGEGIAGTISARTSGGGGLGTDFELGGGLQVAHTLRGEGFDASEDGTGRGTPIVPCIMSTGHTNAEITNGCAPTLTAHAKHEAPILATSTVRRLTPRECERLQGFPDDWTKIPWRGKPAEECPDGNRYKACGNSMAVPVMKWIGERINTYSV